MAKSCSRDTLVVPQNIVLLPHTRDLATLPRVVTPTRGSWLPCPEWLFFPGPGYPAQSGLFFPGPDYPAQSGNPPPGKTTLPRVVILLREDYPAQCTAPAPGDSAGTAGDGRDTVGWYRRGGGYPGVHRPALYYPGRPGYPGAHHPPAVRAGTITCGGARGERTPLGSGRLPGPG